jgi:Tat protein secretion system quality control protein TatD with DNase activity
MLVGYVDVHLRKKYLVLRDLMPALAKNGINKNVMSQLTPEELKSVKDLQSQYNQTIFEVGVAETQILTIEKQVKKLREDKEALIKDLDTIEQKESALIATLQTKYGNGAINPETGEITATQQ